MKTTGTVLLNARGCNINGYDCFVNLSKDCSKITTKTVLRHQSYHGIITPEAGHAEVNGVNSSITKYSPCSLQFSNIVRPDITLNNGPSISSTAYTLSFWAKHDSYSPNSNPTNSEWTDYGTARITTPLIAIFARGYKDLIGIQNAGSSTYDVSFNRNLIKNRSWNHYACIRSGNRSLFFFNGTKYLDRTDAWYNPIYIVGLTAFGQDSYYDDIVFINNQALWTSNFTPPSSYLLDNEYAINFDQVNRKNIIAANVDKKLIIPDDYYGQIKVY